MLVRVPSSLCYLHRFIFLSPTERCQVQIKSSKKPYTITLEFANAVTRSVKVKATSRDVAEHKALKYNPSAIGVKRDASS